MTQSKPTIRMWIMWALAAGFITYMFMLQSSTSVMIPNLMRDFNIDTLGVGLLSSYFFYPYIILQLPAGVLIDRYKPRRVLSASVLLCALSTAAFAYSDVLWQAVLARLVMGASSAPSVAGALYVGLRRLPPHLFALIAGMSEMLGMLGGAFGEAGLAPSVTAFGWRQTLLFCTVAALLLATALWFVLQDRAPHDPADEENTSLKDNFISVLSDKQIWLSGIFAAFQFAPLAAFGGLWAVPYIQKCYHTSLSLAASASAMMFVGTAIGAPLIGYLSDRIGRRKVPMIGATLIALCLSLIIIYTPPTNITWMFVLMLFFGIFSTGYIIPFALAKDLARPVVQGAAMGFTNTLCILLGAPLLQPLIGGLLRYEDPAALSTHDILYSIHDYHVAFITIPLVLVLALACTPFIKETYCEPVGR